MSFIVTYFVILFCSCVNFLDLYGTWVLCNNYENENEKTLNSEYRCEEQVKTARALTLNSNCYKKCLVPTFSKFHIRFHNSEPQTIFSVYYFIAV